MQSLALVVFTHEYHSLEEFSVSLCSHMSTNTCTRTHAHTHFEFAFLGQTTAITFVHDLYQHLSMFVSCHSTLHDPPTRSTTESNWQ